MHITNNLKLCQTRDEYMQSICENYAQNFISNKNSLIQRSKLVSAVERTSEKPNCNFENFPTFLTDKKL